MRALVASLISSTIKKESPNEGTETFSSAVSTVRDKLNYKKRIPE